MAIKFHAYCRNCRNMNIMENENEDNKKQKKKAKRKHECSFTFEQSYRDDECRCNENIFA